jgi:hypothetical protein
LPDTGLLVLDRDLGGGHGRSSGVGYSTLDYAGCGLARGGKAEQKRSGGYCKQKPEHGFPPRYSGFDFVTAHPEVW